MQAPFEKKPEKCKFLRNKGPSQNVGYFTLKLGWLKTNAGTNIGQQNDMHLSAPEAASNLVI